MCLLPFTPVWSLRKDIPTLRSNIAKNLSRVDDLTLEMVIATLAQHHFHKWMPDFSSTPRTMYNIVHQAIAIETFRYATAHHAYSFMGPISLEHANNSQLLIELYDNYFWSYWREKFELETRRPGANGSKTEYNNASKCRSAVCDFFFRYFFLFLP
ncbi:hypothetical protein K435DRAFT_899556 [Dendrothele bispora CBS 962.96]|uniref:Uncharacterized protein n=1 Tax=Dendrothele bispora (strain CBS 962.96) TaxID=1314807 RepID=A0A4S8LYS3_DENBC|nr:hypothetical protein K435DRAFT_899556 [Dendrothele bispora CBS 962.96]